VPGPAVELTAGAARAQIDPLGSRLASLAVDGQELLVPEGDEELLWGCYPMVPWAGRLGEGRFTFQGEPTRLPVDLAPHAIHGLGVRREWSPQGESGFSLDLRGLWPWAGTASTSFRLDADSLAMTLEARAAERPMPVVLGWHPCFRRRRGPDGLPTGAREPVPDGPWDDCFSGVTDPPVLRWSAGPTVTLTARTDTWVVFDERGHAVCVEPQTGPPDAFNLGAAHTLAPGDAIELTLTLSWG
jgi:aldose 1-epimerase